MIPKRNENVCLVRFNTKKSAIFVYILVTWGDMTERASELVKAILARSKALTNKKSS